jgi:hypothetical protein
MRSVAGKPPRGMTFGNLSEGHGLVRKIGISELELLNRSRCGLWKMFDHAPSARHLVEGKPLPAESSRYQA